MDDRELLRAVAAKLGVTSSASVSVGAIFMAYKRARPKGRAWQLERNLLRPFVVRFWRREADTLAPSDWEAHRKARMVQPTRLGRPPCDLTINLELSRTKQMLGFGIDEGMLRKHPLHRTKRVKTRTRRESWFTAAQIDRLLEHAGKLRWLHQQLAFRGIVAAMADTGLRISEALSLRWDRITDRGTTAVKGKGAKVRVIGFTRRALLAMGALPRHANPHVFVNWNTGKVFNASTVRAWFRTAIAAARLEGVKADGDLALVPHLLRHSFASIADERGAAPQWISTAMGHSSLATTRVYLHRNEADAALRMAAIMGERRPARKSPNLNARYESGSPVDKIVERKMLPS